MAAMTGSPLEMEKISSKEEMATTGCSVTRAMIILKVIPETTDLMAVPETIK